MLEINLLPKELQHRRFGFKPDKKLINVIAGGVAIALVLFFYSYFFQISTLNGLENEITEYERQRAEYMIEIKKIEDIELKKTQILARQDAIMTLDTSRDYWVKLMEDLIRRVPDYVWITTFDQATAGAAPRAVPGQPNKPRSAGTSKTQIKGYSFSLNALATLLIRLKKSETFTGVEITSIKLQESDKAKAYSFELTCNLVAPGLKVSTTETAPKTTAAGTQF